MPETFDLSVLQMKYLIGALGGGLVLLAALVLAYLAMWQPRRPNLPNGAFPPPVRSWRAAWAYFPWVVALTIAASAAYGVAMAIAYALNPPNW